MLIVFVSVLGGIFIIWLPSGEKFSKNYLCQHVLSPPAQILQSGRDMYPTRSINDKSLSIFWKGK
jgi:hypothetical protein